MTRVSRWWVAALGLLAGCEFEARSEKAAFGARNMEMHLVGVDTVPIGTVRCYARWINSAAFSCVLVPR